MEPAASQREPSNGRLALLRLIAVAAVAYLVHYFWWRATATLSPDSLGFSLLLLAAEAYGAIGLLLFIFSTWDVGRTAPFQLRPDLRVDVCVPTHGEDVDVLEATLAGCAAIAYPHTTYVLDARRRPEVAALAAQLGCRYLAPETDAAWADGSLNASLPQLTGDFILLLDADMVPQPDVLDRTLGYFVDGRLAAVQLPREYYNLDSVPYAGGEGGLQFWHEESLFFDVLQPGRNRWQAALWCGAPSIIRRPALDQVGGVAAGTLASDPRTSVRLHGAGWKTFYHRQALAFGIAPQTIAAFAAQRLRAAQGWFHLLRTRDNPVFQPGLRPAQRLSYLASIWSCFAGFQRLALLLAPALILLAAAVPFRVEADELLAHWTPYLLLATAARVALGRGTFRPLQQEQYDLLKLFLSLRASLCLLASPRRAQRGAALGRAPTAEWQLLGPLLALLALSLIAAAVGILNLSGQGFFGYRREDLALAAIGWSLVNAGLLAVCLAECRRRLAHFKRRSYRFQTRVMAVVTDANGVQIGAATENLSRDGLALLTTTGLSPVPPITVTLRLADGPLSIPCVVVYNHPLGPDQRQLGVQFLDLIPTDRQRLLTYLFVSVPRAQREGDAGPVPHASSPGQPRVSLPLPHPAPIPIREPRPIAAPASLSTAAVAVLDRRDVEVAADPAESADASTRAHQPADVQQSDDQRSLRVVGATASSAAPIGDPSRTAAEHDPTMELEAALSGIRAALTRRY